jgi:hypothetical protein
MKHPYIAAARPARRSDAQPALTNQARLSVMKVKIANRDEAENQPRSARWADRKPRRSVEVSSRSYNFRRIHETRVIKPARESRTVNHVWTIPDLRQLN